jgi:hypothetical protein
MMSYNIARNMLSSQGTMINKLSYTVASCWSFLYDLYYDARIHERQVHILQSIFLGSILILCLHCLIQIVKQQLSVN